jgi:hypothetical protein
MLQMLQVFKMVQMVHRLQATQVVLWLLMGLYQKLLALHMQQVQRNGVSIA